MHTRRCALMRVLSWPVRTLLKHGITRNKSIHSHGHSHGKILTLCKITINFFYPTVQATVSRNSMPKAAIVCLSPVCEKAPYPPRTPRYVV